MMAAGSEGVLALDTGFSSAMAVGGRATSGATLAGVSVLSVVGSGTTTSTAASSVAALSELRGSSSEVPEEDMVTGLPKACGIAKILGSRRIIKKVVQSPNRYGSKVYHGTHISGVRKEATKKRKFFYFIFCFVFLFISFLVVEHHAHSSGFVQKRRAPTENAGLVYILLDTADMLRQNVGEQSVPRYFTTRARSNQILQWPALLGHERFLKPEELCFIQGLREDISNLMVSGATPKLKFFVDDFLL